MSSLPQRDERYERCLRDEGLYPGLILQGDILKYIKRDIFNLLIRYLKISSTDYKERIDNYTKYLKVKKSNRVGVKYLTITFSHWRKVMRKISHRRKSVRKFLHWEDRKSVV